MSRRTNRADQSRNTRVEEIDLPKSPEEKKARDILNARLNYSEHAVVVQGCKCVACSSK